MQRECTIKEFVEFMKNNPEAYSRTLVVSGLCLTDREVVTEFLGSEKSVGENEFRAKRIFNVIVTRYYRMLAGKRYLAGDEGWGSELGEFKVYKEKNLPSLLYDMYRNGIFREGVYESKKITFEYPESSTHKFHNAEGKKLPIWDEEQNVIEVIYEFPFNLKSENVIVEGVAGSGKSHMLQELRSSGAYGSKGSRIEVVVFHPSTSYEEFVSGVRPNFSKQEGESDFVTQEGTFVQICNRAAQDPDNTYLLFIDEINRANTARVFGDLMLVLEKSKRQEFKNLPQEGRSGALFEAAHQNMPGDYVRLQTPIFKNGKEYNKLAVPTNLHVLGTMNTTDRSVGTIDLALRRRFHWVTQHPFTAEELQAAMEENGEDYPEEIASWYENTNTILLNKVGPDARLGHAYFFGKDGDEEAIAEALLNQLKEVAFTFNISQTILDDIGPVHGQKIITRGSGLGARPDIVEETYQG